MRVAMTIASACSSGDEVISDGPPVVTRGADVGGLATFAQHVGAGANDLRGAPVVHREPDHLDAGEPRLDLDEQRRVGTVEAVDRLRRVADEEHVVTPGSQQVDQSVLDAG